LAAVLEWGTAAAEAVASGVGLATGAVAGVILMAMTSPAGESDDEEAARRPGIGHNQPPPDDPKLPPFLPPIPPHLPQDIFDRWISQAPGKYQPPTGLTYTVGANDRGPGTWEKSPVFPPNALDAAYQTSITGAPAGMEYRVPSRWTDSGWKYFDGFDPNSGNLLDAKRYQGWPVENFNQSMEAVLKDLTISDATAADLGHTFEVIVPDPAKAILIQQIVTNNGLTNTIVRLGAFKPYR